MDAMNKSFSTKLNYLFFFIDLYSLFNLDEIKKIYFTEIKVKIFEILTILLFFNFIYKL